MVLSHHRAEVLVLPTVAEVPALPTVVPAEALLDRRLLEADPVMIQAKSAIPPAARLLDQPSQRVLLLSIMTTIKCNPEDGDGPTRPLN